MLEYTMIVKLLNEHHLEFLKFSVDCWALLSIVTMLSMNLSSSLCLFVALPPKTLDDLTKEEFASLLDVNVLGTFLVSKVT